MQQQLHDVQAKTFLQRAEIHLTEGSGNDTTESPENSGKVSRHLFSNNHRHASQDKHQTEHEF